MIGPGGGKLEHPTPLKPAIPMDDRPAFARRWVAKSLDAAGTRRVLTPAALDALAVLDDTMLNLQGGDWIFFYRDGRIVDPSQYRALFDEAARLVGLLDLRAAAAVS